MFNFFKRIFKKSKSEKSEIEIDLPTVKINGKTYVASIFQKAGTWRNVVKALEKGTGTTKISADENYWLMLNVISLVFNNKDLTVKYLDENLDAELIMPTFTKCANFIIKKTKSASDKLPNA